MCVRVCPCVFSRCDRCAAGCTRCWIKCCRSSSDTSINRVVTCEKCDNRRYTVVVDVECSVVGERSRSETLWWSSLLCCRPHYDTKIHRTSRMTKAFPLHDSSSQAGWSFFAVPYLRTRPSATLVSSTPTLRQPWCVVSTKTVRWPVFDVDDGLTHMCGEARAVVAKRVTVRATPLATTLCPVSRSPQRRRSRR